MNAEIKYPEGANPPPKPKHRSRLRERALQLLREPREMAYWGSHIQLRPYQEAAINAVVRSVRRHLGLTFVWIFPRQSGKDESLALLVQYLLLLFSEKSGGEMVFFNPTFKPQTETSMRRLETRLQSSAILRGRWSRKGGYIYQIGMASCTYMSADPSANIVGATSNRLLVVNEAQDVSKLRYDRDIDPMIAATASTRLFSGTRWTSDTLLERELAIASEAEKNDGLRRVFFYNADDVRQCVPVYGVSVDNAIARLGRQHPLVKTQYFCETIDSQAGMFPPGRQALMKGDHPSITEPEPGKIYSFLIDVAGQDEGAGGTNAVGANAGRANAGRANAERANAVRPDDDPILQNPERDSTALKIVEIDMASVALLGKPTYKVVLRRLWTGERHVTVFGALQALAGTWMPLKIVIDATGVGEGLWSMLDHALGANIVIPVKFSQKVKSQLGYGFLGIVESGRYREYHPFDETFRLQLDHCRSEIIPGPAKHMRWGVPDGTRADSAGETVHDDDLITAALCTILDTQDWYIPSEPLIVPGRDPLLDMDSYF